LRERLGLRAILRRHGIENRPGDTRDRIPRCIERRHGESQRDEEAPPFVPLVSVRIDALTLQCAHLPSRHLEHRIRRSQPHVVHSRYFIVDLQPFVI
jgi:hypothetical protein